MNEPVGTTPVPEAPAPEAPIPETPKKNNNTIIIIVAILLILCCCCIAIFGAAVWLYNNYDSLGDPFRIYGLLPAVSMALVM